MVSRQSINFLLLSVLFTSCIDEIRLDIYSETQFLVVDGQITDSLQEHTIKVNYSANIGSGLDIVRPPVIGAQVRVLDHNGNSFDFAESSPGTYTRFMKGEPGHTYHVEVVTAEGKAIRSHPATLHKAPTLLPPTTRVIEQLTISPTGRNIYDNRLSLEMNADLSEMDERPFLRWRVSGEYEFGEDYPGIIDRKICYVKNNLDFNIIKVFDTSELPGSELKNEPFLVTKYDHRFFYMYCFQLFQYAITEDEYEYWLRVRDIVNIDGSLFDPPPGTVTGNLFNANDPEDQILGYFSVAGVSSMRHFTNATAMGYPVSQRCYGSPWRPQYPECRECTQLVNSSVVRPPYWKP